MSKEIEHILKEIAKTNKDMHSIDNSLSKDMSDVKKYIKNIDNKIKAVDAKIDDILNILNTFAILMANDEEGIEDITNEYMLDEEDTDNKNEDEWSPYDTPEDYEFNDDEEN